MKKQKLFIFLLLLIVLHVSMLSSQDRKLAQTGMKFLNVGASARAAGMGEALTSMDGQSMAMFFNPAGMARQQSFVDVNVGQTEWIADISHNFAAVSINPSGGDWGVFGVSMQFVDYGDFQETVRADNEQGYLDIGTFKPTATAFGLGYAIALSDRFGVGGNVKYVTQNIGSTVTSIDPQGNRLRTESSLDVMVFDIGMLYRTGFKSLNFGVSVRNFSKELKYEEEEFQLPLIFRIGVSMNVMDLIEVGKESQSLMVSVDATHPRDYPEQINIGGEYTFLEILSVRGGYMFNNDEYGFTWGFGAQKSLAGVHLGIDYSYTPFGVFSKVHRLGVQFSIL